MVVSKIPGNGYHFFKQVLTDFMLESNTSFYNNMFNIHGKTQ